MNLSPAVSAWLLLPISALGATTATAYELRTHGLLSERAYGRSAATQEYLRAVGAKPTDTWDALAATEPPLLAGYRNDGTALGWIVEGSIREDDYKTSVPGCDTPHNPPTALDRMRHHFVDVQRGGRGLHVVAPPIFGLPAPAWALGEQGRGSGPEENRFALPDARIYQLRSLIEPRHEDRARNTALLFRSLGQVMHLLEDMAQPQHTRNDFHPGCENLLSNRLLPERSWYEAYIEQRALGRLFRGRPTAPLQIAAGPAPRRSTFGAFFMAPDGTGLADFSSRNFFTAGTNLGGPFDPCDGLAEPACRAELYATRDVPHAVTTARGQTIEAPVRLLLSTLVDPVTSTSIPDVAVTSRSLWDRHLETRGHRPTFSMNVLNYDSISSVLLAQATGHATGLLDHFFRGRIDASVQPGGDPDPAVLRLVATNTSEEVANGTLLVLAEDVETRGRSAVLAPQAPVPLAEIPTGPVPPRAPFPEIMFRAPFATERYVVVYRGDLGQERTGIPATSIGAVAAQVLGGPRAEAIVSGPDGAVLRAVAGTFRFPPPATDLRLVQWSDLDNHFVGVTGALLPTGEPAPDELRLFRVERPVGSVVVPLVAGSDPPVVASTLAKAVAFPYGLTLPTVVDYSQRVRVQQPLLTYDRAVTLHWDAADEVYRVATEHIGAPGLEVAVDETVTFAERFAIVLDREHLFGATAATPRPYTWRVLEVGHDARERLAAVVEVMLTRPTDGERSVGLRARGQDCGGFESRGAYTASGFFQAGGFIALVDVERAEVIGATGAPLFAPSSTELAQVFPLVQERRAVTRVGGPGAGVETFCQDGGFLGEDGLPTELTGTITLPPTGVTQFAVPGLYRADLEAAAGTPVWPVERSSDFQLVYTRSVDDVNRAVMATSLSWSLAGYLTLVREGARMRPAPRTSTEVLLRFDRPEGVGEVRSILARWNPETPSATHLAVDGELDPGRHRLKSATTEAALLVVEDLFSGDLRTVLADFGTNTLRSFDGTSRASSCCYRAPTCTT
jgi:hypothetical protein